MMEAVHSSGTPRATDRAQKTALLIATALRTCSPTNSALQGKCCNLPAPCSEGVKEQLELKVKVKENGKERKRKKVKVKKERRKKK
jgi:hypothetical protein